MQPTLCSKCKKNVAVVFISRMNEKGEPVNEGLCLKCAAQLGLPQVEDMMKRMGITPDDLENLNSEMMQAFGGAEELGDVAQANEDGDEDEESGKTATFPFLNRLFGGNNNPPAEKGETPQRETGKESRKGEKKHKYLDNYCINLSRRAREGKLDAVIGREEEIQRVVQILNRRQKNNPCLIGEPGVGKTAIAEGLAQRIAAGEVPFKLRDKEVYLLDLTALVAGTQFRGQFESRMKGLIEEIRKLGNVILVIDEVHNIVGAGDAEGSMNAANILKPALSRGEIQVIGATTFNEYRKYIEKDTALERRFQPVTVAEPSIEDTLKILKGIAHYYETYHGVSIPEGVLRQAVLLSERYITDRFLPDKAIDLIDEACSDLNLKDPTINRRMEVKRDLENVTFERETLMSVEAPEGEEVTEEQLDQRYARIAELRSQEMRLQEELTELEKKGVPQVTMENIARVIEMWTKIPASKIREEEFKRLAELDMRLKQHIVGQDEAVDAVSAAIRRSRVGISPKHKPVSFIFVGSTGVGKTELAEDLRGLVQKKAPEESAEDMENVGEASNSSPFMSDWLTTVAPKITELKARLEDKKALLALLAFGVGGVLLLTLCINVLRIANRLKEAAMPTVTWTETVAPEEMAVTELTASETTSPEATAAQIVCERIYLEEEVPTLIEQGQNYLLYVRTVPEDVPLKRYFRSSDPSVVTVDENGLLKA